jgi:predicted Rossmann fold flavoprotein
MDVSRAVTGAPNPRSLVLFADFVPAITDEQLDNTLRNSAQTGGKKLVASLLADAVPRRLADALLTRAEIPADRRAAELAKDERARLIEQLKRCEIRVTGTRGFDKAEVTAGGVTLEEVDSRTMQSKLVPNLFLAGEILDLDGFIGGYNFQAAFSTGWLAGESV